MIKLKNKAFRGISGMKKTKLISAVLTASMLVSLCSCSGDNKTVLAYAEEYAKDVVDFDTDSLLDRFADDAEKELELFEDTYNNQAKYKSAYEAVFDSITYEIDQKSVQSSKKDKKASVDITFTMIDYKAVYDEVYDDGGTLDDFIAALEDDDGDNVMEINQTISFVYKNDRWLIKDKKFKNLREIYKFIETIPEYGWGNFDLVSGSEFSNAVAKAFNADRSQIAEYDYDDCREIAYYAYSDLWITYEEYDDVEDAKDEFASIYNSLQYEFNMSKNDGSIVYSYTGDDGYILFNNAYTADREYKAYGGIYLKENVIITVLNMGTNDSLNGSIDSFLSEVRYPMPG